MAADTSSSSSGGGYGELERQDTMASEVYIMSASDSDLASTDSEGLADAVRAGRKTNLLDCVVLDEAAMFEKQVSEISKIKDVFSIPPGIARQLLQHYEWDSIRLLEEYYGAADSNQIFEKANIANPNDDTNTEALDPDGDATCNICYCDYKNSDMSGLACGHGFCRGCWGEYLRVRITSDGAATDITCPQHKCGILADEVTVGSLIEDDELRTKYRRMVARSYIDANPHVKWCPAPGCGRAVLVTVAKAGVVECACGEMFCFQCQQSPHDPASCRMVKEWNSKLVDDSDTDKWMLLNTKECPVDGCTAVIQKAGGCQYVPCALCKTTFCWLCTKIVDHKKHSCNKFEATTAQSDARNELNRYNFFFERYSVHKNAIKFEEKLFARAQEIMVELEGEMSSMHTHYIMDAAKVLFRARTHLMFTYAYGYFLPEGVNQSLFEFLQAELESAVERLSFVLESEDDQKKDRIAVISLTRAVSTQLDNLLAGLREGEIQGGVREDKVYDGPNKIEYDGWVYEAAS